MTGRYTNRYTTRDHWAIVRDWHGYLAAPSKFGVLLQIEFLGPCRRFVIRVAHNARRPQNTPKQLRTRFQVNFTLNDATCRMLR